MSKCPEIREIQFDAKSIAGIEYIRREVTKMSIVDSILSMSAPILIFFGSKPLSQTWNISQFDWHTYRDAVHSLSQIERERIRLEAVKQQYRVMRIDERDFWEAVANGCEI